jgi:putative addiction module component (TIGR02574 family)
MSATEILEAAKALPLHERIEIAKGLWEDIADNGYNPDLTPEQSAELDRRLADFEKNPRSGVPLEQVMAEMRQRFGSKELAPGEAELIDRRLQDHLDNPNDVVSWEEVKAKLDAKYHACLTTRKV